MGFRNFIVVLLSLLLVEQSHAQESAPATSKQPAAKAPVRQKAAAGTKPATPAAKATAPTKLKAGAAAAAKLKTTAPATPKSGAQPQARPKAQTTAKAKPATNTPAASTSEVGLPAKAGDTSAGTEAMPAGERVPMPAPLPVEPVLSTEEFQAQLKERSAAWRAAQLEMESSAAQARIAKGDEQKEAVNVLSRKSREAAIQLGQAVKPAMVLFERDPQEPQVREFLIQSAGIFGRRGRLEEAAVIANKLVAHDCRDAYVNHIAALTALETFDIESAQKYYAVVREQNANSPILDSLFNQLESNRALIDHERDTRKKEAAADDLPRVVLVTSQGEIEIELFEDDYPNAVAHFMKLVDTHFYDRLPFCQVTPGFGAVGGCIYTDGTGGPGYEIPAQPIGEFPRIPMRGAVSLIDMGDGACGSKFLISYSWPTSARLMRTQPVIGRVIRGMDAATELNWVELRQDRVLDYDGIISAHIVRKRPHDYSVVTTQNLAADKFNAGVELLNAGKAANAETPLLEALKIAPRDRNILDAVALVLSQQDRLKEATKYLQRAVDADPHSPDAHHHLGKVLAALDQNRQAGNHYETAIKLKPDFVDARLDLGDLLRKEGRFSDAVTQYSECLKYTPDALLVQQRLHAAEAETAKKAEERAAKEAAERAAGEAAATTAKDGPDKSVKQE